jgi:hypothetical protein
MYGSFTYVRMYVCIYIHTYRERKTQVPIEGPTKAEEVRLFTNQRGSSNLKKIQHCVAPPEHSVKKYVLSTSIFLKKKKPDCLAPPEHSVNRASRKENLRVQKKKGKKIRTEY